MNCYILSGGQSLRMGQPKVGLQLGARTFLERVTGAASQAFETVEVVDARGGGVNAAIFGLAECARRAKGRFWLLGVDFPLITGEVLSYLRERFEAADEEMLVPVWHQQPQMLCAGYSSKVRDTVDEQIKRGDLRMRSLLAAVRCSVVREDELRERFDGEPIWNVNTKEDLEEVRRYCR